MFEVAGVYEDCLAMYWGQKATVNQLAQHSRRKKIKYSRSTKEAKSQGCCEKRNTVKTPTNQSCPWQESREKDPCCVHLQSLRRLKCKEVMVWGLEKNRLKRLSQSSVSVWLTNLTDKTKTVNDKKKKKMKSSFSSCHSCPLSSLLFQVLTYISCTLCDSCPLSE